MLQKTCHKDSACQYAIHVILISSFDIRVMHASIVARSMDCIAIISKLRKMLLRDPLVVARSIDWCANDRSIVRAEQSMDSANRSTARNISTKGNSEIGNL